MTPSPEGWSTKAKEATYPHEIRLALLGTDTVFFSLRSPLDNTQKARFGFFQSSEAPVGEKVP